MGLIIFIFLILNQLALLKKFANDSLDFLSRILLRKVLTNSKAFQDAKLVIFRKKSKDFAILFSLAKKFQTIGFGTKCPSGW